MYVCLYIHIYIYTDIQIYVYAPRNILARPLQETFGAAEGARSRPVSDTLRFVHSGRFSMPGCYVVESKASQSHYDGPMLGWCHASAPLLMHPFASKPCQRLVYACRPCLCRSRLQIAGSALCQTLSCIFILVAQCCHE